VGGIDISGAVFSRRSSAVEHPLRKRVVGGSNPSAGTIFMQLAPLPDFIRQGKLGELHVRAQLLEIVR
jgi:hypothetical protein